MSTLEIINASFSYGNGNIFSQINFDVGKGEIFCLLGPNGCGKTTLLGCVLGFLKLNDGKINFAGRDIKKFKAGTLARFMSYVPQRHDRTFPYSVLEMTTMGRAAYTGLFSSPNEEDVHIAEESLKKVGILHLKDRPYTQLSGGEGQLVLIARALAQQTGVIIMDEPAAHLDFRHELILLETIQNLVSKGNISVIMASHFPNDVFHLGNNHKNTRIAMMSGGQLAAVGRPDDVLRKVDKFNIPCLIINYNSIKTQLYAIVLIGKALGAQDRSSEFNKYFQDCIDNKERNENICSH
jgi:iron complex transport system ATP-binding protein